MFEVIIQIMINNKNYSIKVTCLNDKHYKDLEENLNLLYCGKKLKITDKYGNKHVLNGSPSYLNISKV